MNTTTSANAANNVSSGTLKNDSEFQLEALLHQVEKNVVALEKYCHILEKSEHSQQEMMGAHFINFHAIFSKLIANQQTLMDAYPNINQTRKHERSKQAEVVYQQLQTAVNLGLKILQDIDITTYRLKDEMKTIKDVLK